MAKINPNSKIDKDKVAKNQQANATNYQNWLGKQTGVGTGKPADTSLYYTDRETSRILNDYMNNGRLGLQNWQSVYRPSTGYIPGKSPDAGSNANGGSGGGPRTYTVNAGNQPYVDQLHSLYDQIVNRKPFQYDLNGDLLYREMADRYTQQGQLAMRDTMGQATALTGGYGNSYANQVGNQAYQQYMTALNDNIPQLWDRAYQAYLNEGDQLMQKYELTAAHPGYVDALSPRTYTVTPPRADEKEDDPPAGNQSANNLALMNTGLLAGAPGVSAATNPFNNYYYELLAEELKKM